MIRRKGKHLIEVGKILKDKLWTAKGRKQWRISWTLL